MTAGEGGVQQFLAAFPLAHHFGDDPNALPQPLRIGEVVIGEGRVIEMHTPISANLDHPRALAETMPGATAPDVPDGIHPIAHFLAAGAADVFICYQTTGQSLQGSFDIVLPPPALSVIAEYGGVVVARDAVRREAASGVLASLLSGPAQAVFARYGFLMR